MDESIGHKETRGKRQWTLLPFTALREVVDVLTINAETKYARNNWALVENGTTKYMDATMRHIDAWLTGEKKDPEDGKSHLAHAICDLLFALWFELTGAEKTPQIDKLQPQMQAISDEGHSGGLRETLQQYINKMSLHDAAVNDVRLRDSRTASSFNGMTLTKKDRVFVKNCLLKHIRELRSQEAYRC